MRYPEDFIDKVICGDCFKILKSMPTDIIDLIFADPPYGISKKGRFEIPEKNYKRIFTEWDMKEPDYKWIDECLRILKKGRAIYISGTHHNIFKIRQYIIEKYSENWIRNIITWFKPNAMPIKFAKQIGCYAYSCEYILYITKGKCLFFNYDELKKINKGNQMRDMWEIVVGQDNRGRNPYHPTQKPLELLKRIIIASSKKNEIILDPFLGSGTTAVASKELNRQFIGIEINPEYCQKSDRRLINTMESLF